MSHTLHCTPLQRLQQMIVRGTLVCSLAIVLATTFVVVQEPIPLFAAPSGASMERTDRRPDRERPVTTKGTTTSGDSQGQANNGQRPKLVRK